MLFVNLWPDVLFNVGIKDSKEISSNVEVPKEIAL
jgi:hypothetical protein